MIIEKKLDNKNILMIVASKNFRDEEYFIPVEIFQENGADITTASSVKGEIIGIEGGEVRSTLILRETSAKNFDAVVFVGGEGTEEFFDDAEAHKIVQEAVKYGKILGAICIAPIILARAGVLRKKNATVWSSILDKSRTKELEEAECKISKERVVKDGKIITADGPAVAQEFAQTIVEAIVEKNDEKNE